MREVALERFGPAADMAGALSHGAALLAIFLAGDLPAHAALPLAALLTGAGLLIRALLGRIESDAAHPDGRSHQSATARIMPAYAFFASVSFVLFPEPLGPRGLFILAFAHVPLAGTAASPRGRVLVDVNAGLLLAGAVAGGGALVRFAAALCLVAWMLSLALRHMEERASAARFEGEEDLSLPLSSGGLAAALVLAVFVAGATLLPSDAAPPPRPRTNLEKVVRVVRHEVTILPGRTIAALVLAVASPFLALWAFRKLSEWLRRGAAAPLAGKDDGAGISLGDIEALPRLEPKPLAPPGATRGRAGVVAAYRSLEAALASRDLGRAPGEGATEHAEAIAEKFPEALVPLMEVASRFSAARYGFDDPPESSPRATQKAAEKALRAIDGDR